MEKKSADQDAPGITGSITGSVARSVAGSVAGGYANPGGRVPASPALNAIIGTLTLLAELQLSDCLCMGGALRDTIAGRQPRDLNFVLSSGGMDRHSLARALGHLFGADGAPATSKRVPIQRQMMDLLGGVAHVLSVRVSTVGFPLSFLILDEPVDPLVLIRRFDLGLSQVAGYLTDRLDPGSFVTIHTKAFLFDLAGRTMTMNRLICSAEDFERSVSRFHALRRRAYTGFHLIVPEELQSQPWFDADIHSAGWSLSPCVRDQIRLERSEDGYPLPNEALLSGPHLF